jgi:hypothetical protein
MIIISLVLSTEVPATNINRGHNHYLSHNLLHGAESFLKEADRSLTSQEIPHILRGRKFHYRIHKSPQTALIMSQINPSSPSHFMKMHFNIILPSTPVSPTTCFGTSITDMSSLLGFCCALGKIT